MPKRNKTPIIGIITGLTLLLILSSNHPLTGPTDNPWTEKTNYCKDEKTYLGPNFEKLNSLQKDPTSNYLLSKDTNSDETKSLKIEENQKIFKENFEGYEPSFEDDRGSAGDTHVETPPSWNHRYIWEGHWARLNAGVNQYELGGDQVYTMKHDRWPTKGGPSNYVSMYRDFDLSGVDWLLFSADFSLKSGAVVEVWVDNEVVWEENGSGIVRGERVYLSAYTGVHEVGFRLDLSWEDRIWGVEDNNIVHWDDISLLGLPVEEEEPSQIIPRMSVDNAGLIEVKNTSIEKVKINVKEDVKNANIAVKQLEDKPEGVDLPGVNYKYYLVDVKSITADQIENVEITSKVSKTWIESEKIDRKSLKMYRYDPILDNWENLSSEIIKEDEEHVYIKSTGKRLSLFAMNGQKKTIPWTLISITIIVLTIIAVGVLYAKKY